jgi:hypothetical protein
VAYIRDSDVNGTLLESLINNDQIRKEALNFVLKELQPTPTVDLVILKKEADGSEKVLTIERKYYPE